MAIPDARYTSPAARRRLATPYLMCALPAHHEAGTWTKQRILKMRSAILSSFLGISFALDTNLLSEWWSSRLVIVGTSSIASYTPALALLCDNTVQSNMLKHADQL